MRGLRLAALWTSRRRTRLSRALRECLGRSRCRSPASVSPSLYSLGVSYLGVDIISVDDGYGQAGDLPPLERVICKVGEIAIKGISV